MQKTEFIRQINELVPRPDPVTTEALYRFDRECAETEYIDMLTALRVVVRNFSFMPHLFIYVKGHICSVYKRTAGFEGICLWEYRGKMKSRRSCMQ